MTVDLPVLVIGAGPVGLAAAAHLADRGLPFLVVEAGDEPAAAVRSWGHVRVFSPWSFNTDPVAVRLLEAIGWRHPEPEDIPTGHDIVDRYLMPLAAHPAIAPHVRYGARVVAIARQGYDKMKTGARADAPFTVRLAGSDGEVEQYVRAVIDASGTYSSPNPLGATGVPAMGEAASADRIVYRIPDVRDRDRHRYAGRRVLVVGSGHSAMNALLDLATLAETAVGTEITWAIRRGTPGQMFGGGANDALPARAGIGSRAYGLIERQVVRLVTGFATSRVRSTPEGVLVSDGSRDIGPFDEVISATGFRPDLAPLRELRLSIDPVVESPAALAPLIDPNVHSCGSVPPHGHRELAHPESGFYIVGAKSYGRAPTVLMRTGYEQARSVVAAIAGDLAAADAVELVLPETGVCSSDAAGACCAPTSAAAPARGELLPLLAGAVPLAVGSRTSAGIALLDAPATASACCGSECCDGDPATTSGDDRACCAGDCCSS